MAARVYFEMQAMYYVDQQQSTKTYYNSIMEYDLLNL